MDSNFSNCMDIFNDCMKTFNLCMSKFKDYFEEEDIKKDTCKNKYTGFVGYTTSGRDYTFTRPIIKGEPTKATKVLLDIYNYSKFNYYFTKSELLRRAGVKKYNFKGEFDNLWNSATHQGFIIRKNGKVYPGKNLEDYLKLHNLI